MSRLDYDREMSFISVSGYQAPEMIGKCWIVRPGAGLSRGGRRSCLCHQVMINEALHSLYDSTKRGFERIGTRCHPFRKPLSSLFVDSLDLGVEQRLSVHRSLQAWSIPTFPLKSATSRDFQKRTTFPWPIIILDTSLPLSSSTMSHFACPIISTHWRLNYGFRQPRLQHR